MTKKQVTRTGVLNKQLERVARLFSLLGTKVSLDDIIEYEQFFNKVVKYRGKVFALTLMKHIHWEYTQYLVGRAVDINVDIPMYLKRNKTNRLPKALPFLSGKADGTLLEKRMVLTVLRSYELIFLPPKVDLSTITDGFDTTNLSYRWMLGRFGTFLNSDNTFMNRLRLDFQSEVKAECDLQKGYVPFHSSTKGGVEGKTMLNATRQSLALTDELKDLLCKFSKYFYIEDLRPIIEENQAFAREYRDLCDSPEFRKNVDKSHSGDIKMYDATRDLGRLTFISEEGGKTRLVAMGNYFVQNTLKPLHRVIYRVLRKLSYDGTYNQINLFEMLKSMTEVGPTFGTDMTKATDRFPKEPQYMVLNALYAGIGSTWNNILCKLSFAYEGEYYKYEVGQPMGLYSSWSTFTLTHHCVVNWVYYELGLLITTLWGINPYGITGDDNFLSNEFAAEMYDLIMKVFGIDISEKKSYRAIGQGPSTCEFVKRLAHKGEEITGISPGIIKQGFQSYWDTPEMFNFLVLHGFEEAVRPISEIAKMLRLDKYQTNNLASAFRLSELLGSISFEMGTAAPHQAIQDLTSGTLFQERLDMLSMSMSDNFSILWDKEEEDAEKLRSLFGLGDAPLPPNLVIKRIIETEINDYFKLEIRMRAFIPGEEYYDVEEPQPSTADEAVFENPANDTSYHKLKDLEYLPRMTLMDLLSGTLPNTGATKSHYRGQYIKKLVKNSIMSGRAT